MSSLTSANAATKGNIVAQRRANPSIGIRIYQRNANNGTNNRTDMENYKFIKNNENDVIWWVDNAKDVKGEWLFTFDKKNIFNMFQDYPDKLTKKQREIFDKENPYWADFFKDRK